VIYATRAEVEQYLAAITGLKIERAA